MFKVRKLFLPLAQVNKKICAAYLSSAVPKTNTFQEEKIKIDKWQINYLKTGNGPHHLFCLPGALGTIWSDFKYQIEGLDKDKFTLVVWDPPGYGESQPPQRDFPVDMYDRDAKYAHEFMKALQIPKYSILGWSDGGITGLILAAKYPESVNKLAVIGTNSFILPHEVETYKSIKDVSKWSKKMKDPMIKTYGEKFEKYWASWVDGMLAIYDKNEGDICKELLKDIKCQTLIFYGERDPMVDIYHVSHLHTAIRGSRIQLYHDGKHNVHIKYAENFNNVLEEFLLEED